MDPAEALADLKQISTQIDRAVIVAADGSVEASTLGDEAAAAQMAAAGSALYDAADRTRRDLGRPELTQLEVALPEGSVFAVRHGGRTIVAATAVDPTVGLIFYDLKSCLRTIEEADDAEVAGASRATEAVSTSTAADPTVLAVVEDADVTRLDEEGRRDATS